MAEPSPVVPAPIELGLGDLVKQCVQAYLARREGDYPDPEASERQLQLTVDALNEAAPRVAVGFDCTGDGVADVKTLEEAVRQVGAGACDCRWSPTASRSTRTTSRAATKAPKKAPKKKAPARPKAAGTPKGKKR